MKIALVHDYLSQDGGAERVLKAFTEIWPQAPVFVLFHDKKKIDYIDAKNVRQSFLAYLPFNKRMFQWYLPLMPIATEKHNLHEFDLVLSSTSSFAKGILTRPDTLHISYCHTPPRFLWTDTHEYVDRLHHPLIAKIFLPRLIHKLRIWDKMAVDRVDHFISNSYTVKKRINKYYRRNSEVVYPPIKVDDFSISETDEDYFVAGGRLVGYKRIELIIQAFNRLKLPIKIFGIGPEMKRLQKISRPNIEFLGKISETKKADLLGKAKAFIHPQVEDFGITPIESMACGRPVIAYAAGGATETIDHNKTGVFFHQQNWEMLAKAIIEFDEYDFDKEYIRSKALKYNTDLFKIKMQQYVEHLYEEFKQGLNQMQLLDV